MDPVLGGAVDPDFGDAILEGSRPAHVAEHLWPELGTHVNSTEDAPLKIPRSTSTKHYDPGVPATTANTFPASLRKLHAEFANTPAVRSSDYKEDWTRAEYIEPLFEALGWTRVNPARISTLSTGYVREIPLDRIGFAKSPDYGFYVAGRRIFYAEAKKPWVKHQDGF